jgi:hypothetical protein
MIPRHVHSFLLRTSAELPNVPLPTHRPAAALQFEQSTEQGRVSLLSQECRRICDLLQRLLFWTARTRHENEAAQCTVKALVETRSANGGGEVLCLRSHVPYDKRRIRWAKCKWSSKERRTA